MPQDAPHDNAVLPLVTAQNMAIWSCAFREAIDNDRPMYVSGTAISETAAISVAFINRTDRICDDRALNHEQLPMT